MASFKLVVKNYRCFSDSTPLVFELRPGFTGLVGPNNTGKSTLLRFFYEFRDLFRFFETESHIGIGENTTSLQGAGDWNEIFHNQNRRDITINIEDLAPQAGEVQSIDISLSRALPNSFKASYIGKLQDSGAVIPIRRLNPGLYALENNATVNVASKRFANLFGLLANSLYVGPFRNAINQGAGSYFDLAIGTSFIEVWNNWKNGDTLSQNQAIQSITEDIKHIFDFKTLEINPSNDRKTLKIIVDGSHYGLKELGAGIAQFIIVLGNLATRKPRLLLVDEPELNLHPSLQSDFLTTLASYTQDAVIFATHSIGLARVMSDSLYTFKKINHVATVRPFAQTPNYAEFLGEMSFSSFSRPSTINDQSSLAARSSLVPARRGRGQGA
ncbi:MAG: hypothetical protein JWM16_1341 [Verrucomicrobiales bacterium]|nr:hypothetical protein [Verrucomicrobiales bacterium]